MNILAREKGTVESKTQQDTEEQQKLNPECPETRLVIWDNDEFEGFDIDFLNQVYPDKLNKDTLQARIEFTFHFLSKSLYYWIELKQGEPKATQPQKAAIQSTENKQDEILKLGLKDVKFMQNMLSQQSCDNSINYNRWGKKFLQKQQFHKKESEQSKFKIPNGEQVKVYFRNEEEYRIVRYFGSNKQFIPYKQRFEILFLFYIDGVSFVDEENDQWQYFVIYKTIKKGQETDQIFVGVLSKYIFKLTAVKVRNRISQVFVMPAYQKQGHGKELLDLVYDLSLSQISCFQITTEIPSFQYQCLRDYKELQLILKKGLLPLKNLPKINTKNDMEIVQHDYLLTKQILRKMKIEMKLPGNQIQRLVHLIIYAKILSQPESEMALAYFQQSTRQQIIFNRSAFKSRKKMPSITFQGNSLDMKQFLLEKAKQDYIRNQEEIQQILMETLDGFRRVILKLNKNALIVFE